MSQTSEPQLGFDPAELRARYEHERDRRMRAGRIDSSVTDGQETGADVDPFMPVVPRAPVSEDIDILVVGGGFSGLIAGASLVDRGFDSFRILEKAGDFGGVWYWNRYPGAQCDVESYIYLPLLEETGYIPREKYAYQPEILAHAQRIGRHYGLYEKALFHTCVRSLEWSDEDHRWHATSNRGDRLSARFVLLAGGGLDRPKTPKIPGIESFKGKIFHTSRWDFDYTGGDASGGLRNLHDKTVAIVGTGATAIQCVPYLARDAAHLYVLQRTPSVVGDRLNAPTDPEWAKSLTPGWQRRRMDNYTTIMLGGKVEHDLVDDGWTRATRALASVYGGDWSRKGEQTPEQATANAELADYVYMNKVRARIDATVGDKAKAELLKPWYRYFCKRPLFNDEYLPAFNRDNVELVDIAESGGIDRITERGFIANGKAYEVDCIVFASGFGADAAERDGFDLRGRGGRSLSQHWRDGARTLHGVLMHGFPNVLLMGIVHTGFTVNYCEMAQAQADHVVALLAALRDRGVEEIEADADAEEAYVQGIIEGSKANYDFHASCTPGYFNGEGRHTLRGRGPTNAQYVAGLIEWKKMVAAWREGALPGATLR